VLLCYLAKFKYFKYRLNFYSVSKLISFFKLLVLQVNKTPQHLAVKCYKNTAVTIHLTFVQYMKHSTIPQNGKDIIGGPKILNGPHDSNMPLSWVICHPLGMARYGQPIYQI